MFRPSTTLLKRSFSTSLNPKLHTNLLIGSYKNYNKCLNNNNNNSLYCNELITYSSSSKSTVEHKNENIVIDRSKLSFLEKQGKLGVTADVDYNRWLIVPPAVLTHICLGGVYAWSLFNPYLTHELGIVSSVGSDWTLSQTVPVFSLIVLMNGVAGATLGKWTDRVGPRISLFTGGLLYGGGWMLGGLSVSMHSLPLLYSSFVMAGLGHGICYISPISTLISWFPERPGFAAGMAICGLGGGVIFVTPFADRLIKSNFKLPSQLDESLYNISDIVMNEKGEYFINNSQVVKPDKAELLGYGIDDSIVNLLNDNSYYLVGSGESGVSQTLLLIGATYASVILGSSLFTKVPNPNRIIDTSKGSHHHDTNSHLPSMTVSQAVRTPQFACMWLALFCCSTAGMGVISAAKTIMSSAFRESLPHIVTAAFSSGYIMAISGANLAGRIGWAGLSDKISQYKIFSIFGFGGCLLYAAMPYWIYYVTEYESILPLAVFYGSTLILFSFFGGGFATMPAYEANIFGRQFIGGIHGRMMTSVAVAGVFGPRLLNYFRDRKEYDGIMELSKHFDNDIFENKFGAPLHEIDTLIQSKAVTITKLLDALPDDIKSTVQDPTPFLFDNTMYAMSSMMAICALANIGIRKFGIPSRRYQL